MSSARRDAARAFAPVAADGTDPDHLLAVVCWGLRPRRSFDALRRACRDEDARDDAPPPARALASAAGAPPSHLLEPAAQVARTWHRFGVRAALVGDPQYPPRLAEGWPEVEAPSLVAWRGAPAVATPAVAIVGARRATGYGLGVAAWLAEAAARAGARVISGGATGVDAAAHEAALEEPGGTTVVLGCGHAVDYPRDHARPGGLFDRVLDHGGTVLGELLPYQAVHPGTVRARNRIVAGMADAVVVVEGRERSGALVTASAAAELGRQVLAVPGDVRAPGSAAPHLLLGEGAAPCTAPADLLEVLGADAATGDRTADRTADGPAEASHTAVSPLPAAVHQELASAWPRPIRTDDLARRCGLAPGRLLAAVTRARVAGLVAESVDGVRLRRPPAERG